MSVIVSTQIPAATEPSLPGPVFRLSVDRYHEMINHGILTEDDPVELLEGILVEKMPKNPAHSASTRKSRENLPKVLPGGWFLDSQEPITTQDSEPEPDLAIIRGGSHGFLDKHPHPQDVELVGEISDSSLARDRGSKKRLYARAGIPVYWIINLLERKIEVYTDPSGPGEKPDYGRRQDFAENDEVPVILDGSEVGRIRVKDLLP